MNHIAKFAVCSATIGVMALPSLLLVRSASAQPGTPNAAQIGGGQGGGGGFGGGQGGFGGGQGGLGGGGGFGGQGGFGGGFGGGQAPQGFAPAPFGQGPPPIGQIVQDSENLYVVRGETIFKISKHDMRVLGEVTLPRPREMANPGGFGGGGGMGGGLGSRRNQAPPPGGGNPPPPSRSN